MFPASCFFDVSENSFFQSSGALERRVSASGVMTKFRQLGQEKHLLLVPYGACLNFATSLHRGHFCSGMIIPFSGLRPSRALGCLYLFFHYFVFGPSEGLADKNKWPGKNKEYAFNVLFHGTYSNFKRHVFEQHINEQRPRSLEEYAHREKYDHKSKC